MSIFPKDYKLKVVNAKSNKVHEALGFTSGDMLDIKQQSQDYLLKLKDINTQAEVAEYLQHEVPHYMLAILTASMLHESFERFKDQRSFKDLIDMLDKIKATVKKDSGIVDTDNKESDDDDECSNCENKDDCPDFLKEMHRKAGK
jgi:hypothetical protein